VIFPAAATELPPNFIVLRPMTAPSAESRADRGV